MPHQELDTCKDEADIYAALGMAYIEPELREDMGEIEAAERHTLPTLVQESDLRGILHVHSTWSDGQNTHSRDGRSLYRARLSLSGH